MVHAVPGETVSEEFPGPAELSPPGEARGAAYRDVQKLQTQYCSSPLSRQ